MFRRPKVDQCETCHRWLTRKQTVAVTGIFHTADGPGAITAVYCRKHAPKGEA